MRFHATRGGIQTQHTLRTSRFFCLVRIMTNHSWYPGPAFSPGWPNALIEAGIHVMRVLSDQVRAHLCFRLSFSSTLCWLAYHWLWLRPWVQGPTASLTSDQGFHRRTGWRRQSCPSFMLWESVLYPASNADVLGSPSSLLSSTASPFRVVAGRQFLTPQGVFLTSPACQRRWDWRRSP